MALGFLKKLGGSGESGDVKKLRKVAAAVNARAEETEALSDSQLKAKTAEFKERHEKGESLDNLMPEAFAVVREAANRVIKERHFDVQLMGGASLHKGSITEMKTGEGKTLTATLPAYLNAISGKGVHVVTVNEYLAKRDTEWMGQVYQFLGLTVGNIYHGQDQAEKRAAYAADITYGTNNEFGFDYLRDNMVGKIEDVVQRELNFAIVDEVDSILIDEARTPLIISAPSTQSGDLYKKFAALTPKLKREQDFTVDEKRRTAVLTDDGIKQMEQFLGVDNIYEAGGVMMVHHLEQALQAQAIFQKDKEYVVKDGEVVLVDEFTGRLMPGRRFSEGLHQAIEAKEGVKIQEESRTMATITFQNYFRLYEKLSGMTGTAKTEEEEFHKIYSLDVTVIPTHRELVRQDDNDLIYKTADAKFNAIAAEVKQRQETGQPVLLGTIAVEKSEVLSGYLTRAGVKHEVLNAKNHAREAEIVADAGQKGAVTVSTNMAGRGTDIKLGEGVADLGGLHVIGSERHESRRIDNQLRGRSGRQGDPGSTQFFVSLEDDLMRIFAGDRIKGIMERLKVPDDQPIEAKMISKSIESAQKKVEGHNFDIRKHVVQYDDVKNRHREVIYDRRRKLLEKEDTKPQLVDMFTGEVDLLLAVHASAEDSAEWDYQKIAAEIQAMVPVEGNLADQLAGVKTRDELRQGLLDMIGRAYQAKEEEQGEENMRTLERAVMLQTVDALWVDHLDALEHLRDDVDLRRYGQKDPLAEYKAEAFRLFEELLGSIQAEATRTIFKVTLQQAPQTTEVEQAAKNLDAGSKGTTKGKKATVGTPEPGEEPIDEPAKPPKPKKKPAKTKAATTTRKPTQKKPEPEAPSTTKVKVSGPGISDTPIPVDEVPVSETKEGSTTIRVKTREGNAPSQTQAGSSAEKIGRNDPCPCGSGKKYKKCGLINSPEHQANLAKP